MFKRWLPVLLVGMMVSGLSAGEARIHGFFVQPELGYGATDFQNFGTQAEWDSWLGSMKALGAEMLFYQWSVRYQDTGSVSWFTGAYPSAPAPGDYAHYDIAQVEIHGVRTQSWGKPTSWPGTSQQPGGKESITYLLDAAKNNGMKIWLGLYLCEQDFCSWWSANDQDDLIDAEDSLAIEHNVQRSIQVAQDLLTQYGTHPGLGGLYYSIEPANIAFMHPNTRPVLASAIDRVAKAVHTAQPGTKLAICPFFNVALSTAQEYGDLWDYVLENSDLDILMLQDGVGVEPRLLTASNDQVSEWYSALRAAADKHGVEFWGNAELFTNLVEDRGNPQLVPSNLEKIQRQLETMAPYVDKIVSFAYSYLDPDYDIFTFANGLYKTERTSLYNELKEYYEAGNWVVSLAELPLKWSFRFEAIAGGALVEWHGAPTRWVLRDLRGRQVTSGWLQQGRNQIGWGPLAPGRYYWNGADERRVVEPLF